MPAVNKAVSRPHPVLLLLCPCMECLPSCCFSCVFSEECVGIWAQKKINKQVICQNYRVILSIQIHGRYYTMEEYKSHFSNKRNLLTSKHCDVALLTSEASAEPKTLMCVVKLHERRVCRTQVDEILRSVNINRRREKMFMCQSTRLSQCEGLTEWVCVDGVSVCSHCSALTSITIYF